MDGADVVEAAEALRIEDEKPAQDSPLRATEREDAEAVTHSEERSKDSRREESRDSSHRHRSSGRDKDRDRSERKSSDKDRVRDRDRDRDRGRDRDKGRDRDRDRDQGKRKDRDRERRRDKGRDDRNDRRGDGDRRDSKRSRRSRSREPRRKDSRERRSSRRSRSKSRRRSRSPLERRRSRSRGRRHRRSRSPSRPREYRSRHRRSYSSESDFGGYVPRKRQEAPQAAAGYSTAFVDPYAALRSKQPMPTDPESIKKKMQEQQLRARQMVLQQQASSAVAAASKTQREIYVGNLVQGLVTEDALRQLFNSTMKAAFPEQQIPGADPVVSASMHSEGRYAFVELRTPEMASAALQLSGQVQLLGQNISVGRPSGYVDPSAAQMAAAQAATALQAFEAGQMSLAEATQAMNTIAMPGVSSSEPPIGSPSKSPLALPAPPPSSNGAELPAVAPSPGGPTTYLQVNGMVNAEVLIDNEEYAEIIEDLQEECSKFGQLLHVFVPRPPNPAESASFMDQGFYGKAFVHFAEPEGCAKAKAAIHGRLFAGTTIEADFVTEETFRQATVV